AKQGAGLGALAGAGACAVWLGFQNQKDKEYMQRVQQRAASSGARVGDTWTGPDGHQRTVVATPSMPTPMRPTNAQTVAPTPQVCMRMNTKASVDGSADQLDEVWCRDDKGNWGPATQPMSALS